MMKVAFKQTKVMLICTKAFLEGKSDNSFLLDLDKLNSDMELIMKAVFKLMNDKRAMCSRFYFITDDEMLVL